jgi:hypothetical protein
MLNWMAKTKSTFRAPKLLQKAKQRQDSCRLTIEPTCWAYKWSQKKWQKSLGKIRHNFGCLISSKPHFQLKWVNSRGIKIFSFSRGKRSAGSAMLWDFIKQEGKCTWSNMKCLSDIQHCLRIWVSIILYGVWVKSHGSSLLMTALLFS